MEMVLLSSFTSDNFQPKGTWHPSFLAVQNSSIGDLVTNWLTDSQDFTNCHSKSDPGDLWPLRHLFRVMRRHNMTKKLTKTNTKTKTMTMTMTKTMTMTETKTFWEHLLRAILETCDIWDTDYNSDNWEPEFMTIFVTWKLIVILDSIRNSCDV